MDRVTVFASCVIGLAALSPAAQAAGTAPSAPSRIDQWQGIIGEAATRFGVPDVWIRSVMQVESGGHARLNGKPITSPKGAMGLMQLMPDTYRDLRIQFGLGSDAYDPHDNIFAGAAYLRQMYDRYGYPSLFAAYNAGPKRLEDYLFGGRALPQETLDYLSSIIPDADVSFSPTPNLLPLLGSKRPTADDLHASPPRRDGLFFDRKDVSGPDNLSAEAVSNIATEYSETANFAATNTAALFVPLAASAQ